MSEKDLIPLNQRTKDEQKEICRRGGKRSGEVRRQQKAMKEIFETIKDAKVKDPDLQEKLKRAGLSGKDMTYGAMLAVSAFDSAIGGNAKMAELVLKTLDAGKEKGDPATEAVIIIDDIPDV